MDILFEELGRVGVIALAVLILVQVGLQLAALVHLIRTPAERVTIGGRKWAWGLIIVFGELIGPILWFAMGRKPAEVDQRARTSAGAAGSAVDTLYGPKE